MDVSIIIVNYNTKALTHDCLRSVFDKTFSIKFEVIVVDNSSSDGSVELIKKDFPNVKLIENADNVGFGRANNIGIRLAKGKYVFLLNSDTILINNAVKSFFNFMETSSKDNIGAIGGYLLDADHNIIHSYCDFPTIGRLFLSDIKILIGLLKQKKEEQLTVKPVDYITGADLFMSKTLLDKIGVFDPVFFIFYEETDLQYRMKRSGYERLIVPGPAIIHFEGKSTSISNQRRLLFEESKFKYLRKHHNKFLVFLYKYCYILMRIPKLLKFDYSLRENRQYFLTLLKI